MSQTPATATYRALLVQVQKTLLEGQRRIEEERVKTYWETGRLINAHILKNKGRADYGGEVIKRLAEDLKVEKSTLQRCRKFSQIYPRLPIVAPGQQFTWTHYRQLMTVSDIKKRAKFQKAVLKNEWTSKELARRIKETRMRASGHLPLTTDHRLTPSPRGDLYTYTTVTPAEVFAVTGKVMADCGFNTWRRVAPRDFPGTAFKAQMSYTYRAFVEKIIDGDTLWAHIDLGLSVFTRQKLRLRGIDTPEINTAAGQKAKAYVAKALKGVETITVVTSKSDKYDRYLADVWVGDEYLNQKLLDEGLAERWR